MKGVLISAGAHLTLLHALDAGMVRSLSPQPSLQGRGSHPFRLSTMAFASNMPTRGRPFSLLMNRSAELLLGSLKHSKFVPSRSSALLPRFRGANRGFSRAVESLPKGEGRGEGEERPPRPTLLSTTTEFRLAMRGTDMRRRSWAGN